MFHIILESYIHHLLPICLTRKKTKYVDFYWINLILCKPVDLKIGSRDPEGSVKGFQGDSYKKWNNLFFIVIPFITNTMPKVFW